MEYKAFLIKYAEIGTKGKNRYIFEDILCKEIRNRLKKYGSFTVRKEYGRIFVDVESDYDYEDVVAALSKIFGINGICPVLVVEDKEYAAISKQIVEYIDNCYDNKNFTFKVNARRNDKQYPMDSMSVNKELGHDILEAYPEMKVDVHNPEVMLNVEIRHQVYVYSVSIPGAGGLPVGTNGKAMVLLSGGIDSPVASYMISKRGVKLEAVYFHAPPYTSERAKQKVVDLAKLVSEYSGAIRLHIVNFTDIQLYIYDNCPHEELTIIMKRYMVKIAEELAKDNGCQAIVTGESIGQVSSQTMQSLAVIDDISSMLIFRPCIGMDKQEIIDISEKINTYETSIQPYEDCCTTFVAKHPVTKPKLEMIEKSEQKLTEKIDEMLKEAIETAEVVNCYK